MIPNFTLFYAFSFLIYEVYEVYEKLIENINFLFNLNPSKHGKFTVQSKFKINISSKKRDLSFLFYTIDLFLS